jgi:hypothetical protein
MNVLHGRRIILITQMASGQFSSPSPRTTYTGEGSLKKSGHKLVDFNQWNRLILASVSGETAAACIMVYLVYTCAPNAETKAKTPLLLELSSK